MAPWEYLMGIRERSYVAMNAVFIDQFGGPEVLTLRAAPDPALGASDVRVRVRAASVNPVDAKIRRGEVRFISGSRFPMMLGGDFSGEVEAVGSAVRDLRPGQEVFGVCKGMGGAYADRVVTRAERVALKPRTLSHTEAACLPVAGSAALQGLEPYRQRAPGQRVLIHGCTGGLGVFALQIARRFGAHVTGTCRAEVMDIARDLGAHEVINYRSGDLDRAEPFDVILDLSGKLPFTQARSRLTPRGVFINPTPTPVVILGAVLGNPFRRQQHQILLGQVTATRLKWLAEQVESGGLRVRVDRSFPLEAVREASMYAEAGGIVGKVVLDVP